MKCFRVKKLVGRRVRFPENSGVKSKSRKKNKGSFENRRTNERVGRSQVVRSKPTAQI